MCTNVCKAEMQRENIIKITRLGKKKENGDPRPLLITLSDETVKRNIMRNLYRLKNGPDDTKNIKVNHDMSPAEREEAKKLYEECKRLQSMDQSENWIYRVRGPPWDRKIKKLKAAPLPTTQ